jgi:hypothetical protein
MKKATKIILSALFVVLISIAGYELFKMVKLDRYQEHMERPDYASLIEPHEKSYTTTIGERVEISLKITNQGKIVWMPVGEYPFYISYHLLGEHGKIIKFDNRRYPLSKKIMPGEEINVTIDVRGPLVKGEYILEFDLLREGLFWFEDQGSKTSEVVLLVNDKKWQDIPPNISLDYGKYTHFSSRIPELEKIYKLFRLTLEKNEVEFKGKEGTIHGFSAGGHYPQIWLRDANTTIGLSKYFYDTSYLTSWFKEHLAYQKQDSSLNDWIDSQGRFDKNTVGTDQEASAVQIARQIFEIFGATWLKSEIKEKTIIERLEQALNFVFQHRLDSNYGLIKGAHTADWGDVDILDEGEAAVYVDERTNWTVDIYDQSMIHQACLNLSEMLSSLGMTDKSSYWREKAKFLKTNTNTWLWQPDKGFYKIHVHLDDMEHDFDEDDILALGGNTQAILSGLANDEQITQIIENVLDRQKTFNISTISGTLLPPYPAKIFKHPLLENPYNYQNGAQWDWFGGRFIQAMFAHGFSQTAEEKLMEIFGKNLSNRGFFEWENREGVGNGSDFFCGSAGSLGKALFEGYFGMKLTHDRLIIEPKLGQNSAKVHIYIPANDTFIAYDYIYDMPNATLTMRYNSNFPHRGKLKILVSELDSGTTEKEIEKTLMVRQDGEKIPFRIERKNNDVFLIIDTDFNNHEFAVSKTSTKKP